VIIRGFCYRLPAPGAELTALDEHGQLELVPAQVQFTRELVG